MNLGPSRKDYFSLEKLYLSFIIKNKLFTNLEKQLLLMDVTKWAGLFKTYFILKYELKSASRHYT